jgi:hypothetical protein
MMLAITPALPLHTAGKYVAGAYIVLLLLVVIYAGSLAVRVAALGRDVAALEPDEEPSDE